MKIDWWDVEVPLWEAAIFIIAVIIVVSQLFGRLIDKAKKKTSNGGSTKR